MGFTTPAFIRKNTPELRKKLEKLGYNHSTDVIEDERFCIATSPANYNYHIIKEGSFNDTNPHSTWNCAGRIDCGTNEELFIAISALRDDTDNFQWFTDSKKWFQCQYLKVGMYYHDKPEILFEKWHKATVNELIEHFKEEEE